MPYSTPEPARPLPIRALDTGLGQARAGAAAGRGGAVALAASIGRAGAWLRAGVLGVGLTFMAPGALQAQELDDPVRLAGVTEVAVRASAVWDELITTSAGGATEAQFEEALLAGFGAAIAEADTAPRADPDARDAVRCHVDTFYESGLIIYSVRVALHRPAADGREVITWLRSWVGSYTAQQLHVIWQLSDQCASTFLDAWRAANPG